MKKATYTINLTYTFDPVGHKGAPYSLDGERWTNGGELAEVITKSVLGYTPKKDQNTRYDKASDIEELNASVKSSRFTLANVRLGDTFEESVRRYFETVHSTQWIYTVLLDDTAVLYTMCAEEFAEFLRTFATVNERGFIRGRATSGKMVKWLEERADA